MAFKPISKLILQAADGSVFYSAVWDATTGITLIPGSGAAVLTHNGNSYPFVPSDPSAAVTPSPLALDAPYQPDAPL